MNKQTLKNLRFIIPGILFYFFTILLGKFTGLWSIVFPKNWKEFSLTSAPIILGFLYYSIPFRDIANKKYYENINDTIIFELKNVAGPEYENLDIEWPKFQEIFYHYIDKNASLQSKSTSAYFNGVVWSTWADIRAISLIFLLFSILLYFIDIEGANFSLVFFTFLFLISFIGSHSVTIRHKKIGKDQINMIGEYYMDDLKERLDKFRV